MRIKGTHRYHPDAARDARWRRVLRLYVRWDPECRECIMGALNASITARTLRARPGRPG